MSSRMFLAVLFCLGVAMVIAEPPLENFGARSDMVSVSGISSGADMAVQMHVAYSSSIMGAGLIAGGPYYCARGSSIRVWANCMATGNINVDYLATTATNYAYNTGTIDATSNLANSKVYIFSGSHDTIIVPAVSEAAAEYYSHFMPLTNIKTVYNIPAGHSMVTDGYGNACGYQGSPNINDCGYSAAYELLNHIYGGLTRPTGSTQQNGDFVPFDQTEYFWFNNANAQSIAESGFVYVPSGCRSSASDCKVHLALHGCLQQSELLDDEFALNAGYNEVGELNDIIIIYPQTIKNLVKNPQGCWDWWGYTTVSYASNLAPQMQFLKALIDRATT